MPVSLSIKNVPDELAQAIRERARRNHRSLQGELMAILEGAALAEWAGPGQAREPASSWGLAATESRDGPREGPTVGRIPAGDGRRHVASPSESVLLAGQMREGRTFTIDDLYGYVRSLGLKTPSESAGWIRRMRDAR